MKQRKISLQPYPFIMLLSALVTGILLQDNIKNIPISIWLSGLFIAVAAAFVLHFFPLINRSYSLFRNELLLSAFLFLGGTLCYYQNIENNSGWYGKDLAHTEALEIQLDEAPIEKPKTLLLPASVKAIYRYNKWLTAKGKLMVYVYKKDPQKQFTAGQTLVISNELVSIKSSGNPFAFEQSKYANRNGIFHQCFLSEDKIVVLDGRASASGLISRLKQSIRVAIDRNIEDKTTKALVLAMIVNDRAQLEPELVNAYSTTGITHIIAISGAHIILLATIILFLLGKIPIRVVKNSKYLGALILVWIYIAITAFPPSAVRAGVMFSIFAIGTSIKRDSQQVNSWAASGFLLLCHNPYWIYDVGFQLSFLAVLSLLLFTKSITDWWQPANRILNVLWKTIAVSISVQILVFPLVIYYFNQFPLLGFIANIPAGFFSVVLMIGTMLLILLNSISCSGIWIGKLLTYLAKVFHSFIFILSGLSPGKLRLLYIDAIDYWVIMLIIICLCIFLYFKKPVYLFATLTFSILMTANFIRKDWNALHQERIIVYNTNNERSIDIIQGKSIRHLFPFNEKTYKYALKPAILGFHAKETTSVNDSTGIYLINNKRILVLGAGKIKENQAFPVDALIVSDECTFEPDIWFKTFHPKMIILDGRLPRWKALKWKETLTQAGATTYWVQDSGAWVYPAL